MRAFPPNVNNAYYVKYVLGTLQMAEDVTWGKIIVD